MLGQDDLQKSFFDAGLAVEGLLKRGSFYEALHRMGPRLVSDEDFAECYDVTTGRPSVPPSRMFKLVLLQGYEALSDRQAIERMAFDLRWKAALGLEVHDRPVAQSTLVEFRARVQLHEKMEQAFGRLMQGLLEAGIVSPDEVQVLDSSAIWGRGAVEDTYNLIGSAIRKLLGVSARRRSRSTGELATEIGLVLTAPAEHGSLKGRAGIDWSDPEARRAFLNQVVQEGRLVLGALSEDEASDPEVAEAAALLRRILVQDLEPVAVDDASDDVHGRPGQDGDQAVLDLDTEVDIRQGVAKDRVVSAGDPEMRRGHKSRSQGWDGYKAHVSVEASQGFITAVEVTPANVHDGAAAPELIQRQKEQGLSPAANVGDMAYSAADLRQWATEQGTEIVARVPPARGKAGCFGKDDFEIDLAEETVRCPAGQVARTFHNRSDGGRTFTFDGAVCADCALRERCTRIEPEKMRKTGRGRSISWHRLESVLQAAREAEKTERVQQLLARRWIVEQGIARLMRRGLRQARYKGARKVRFQAVTTALIANLVRLIGLSPGSPLPNSPVLPSVALPCAA